MPNTIAYIALALSPIFVAVLFARLPTDRAIIWSLILCYLFLPEQQAKFDLPLIPALHKHSLPAATIFFLLMLRRDSSEHREPLLPRSVLGKGLVLTFIFAPFVTGITNSEPVVVGNAYIPGLRLKDAVSEVLRHFLMLLPFLVARQHIATGGGLRQLVRALMIAGVVYSVLMLFEIRFSPQLNNLVYGYFQHLFSQTIRFGGYRPMVFLYHGLWAAFFLMTAVVAAFALWRHETATSKTKLLAAGLYLAAVLVLAKSTGAVLYMILLVPLVIFVGTAMQVRIALVLGLLAFSYPLMKGADLVPEDYILSKAAQIGEERAHSLRFRFDNESALLERARLKPVFGWGTWDRNQILDPVSGRVTSVADGRWIIVLGITGWVGFAAEFGLLLLPLLLIARQTFSGRNMPMAPLVGPVCLLLAVNMIDLLPNATLTPLTWLIAGTLTGYAERRREDPVEEKKTGQRVMPMRWRSVM